MISWDIVGLIAASITTFGFVPQIIKTYQTKSVDGLSFITLIQFGLGIILWTAYGIHLGDYIIVGANIVTGITLIVLIILFIIYKKQ